MFNVMFYIIILSQVTVVSVASPTSNATQKSMTLPVNVALGQQILTVQQSTSGSPVKLATGQNTAQVGCPAFLQNARSNLCERKRATFICTRFLNVTFYKSTFQMWRFNSTMERFQNIKPVQSVTMGGVGGSQFKTIIPLGSQPNVQQIQVPGSRFHYVRLVTSTTASSLGHPSGPSTSSLQTGDLLMVLYRCQRGRGSFAATQCVLTSRSQTHGGRHRSGPHVCRPGAARQTGSSCFRVSCRVTALNTAN